MKRFIPGIAILLILSLTACSAPKTPPKDTGDASNSQSEGIIRLDEGEWPVNEYTDVLGSRGLGDVYKRQQLHGLCLIQNTEISVSVLQV